MSVDLPPKPVMGLVSYRVVVTDPKQKEPRRSEVHDEMFSLTSFPNGRAKLIAEQRMATLKASIAHIGHDVKLVEVQGIIGYEEQQATEDELQEAVLRLRKEKETRDKQKKTVPVG